MTGPACPPRSGSSELLLLALETAGSGCSAAILRGGETLAAEARPMRHGHAEALLPMIDRVANAAGVEPGELALVAAATGPGGFTGIRAGLAAARGIALAAGARLVGVTSFAAVAAASRARRRGCRTGQGVVEAGDLPALLIALDSRRADFYVQLFAEDHATPLAEPAAVPPDRLRTYVAEVIGGARVLIAGDMAELAAAVLGLDRPTELIRNSAPDALGVADAVLFGLQSDAAPEATVDHSVRPLYLRPPDVTLPPAKISVPADRR